MKTGAALALVGWSVVWALGARSLYRFGSVEPDWILIALLYLAWFAPTLPLLALAAPLCFLLDAGTLDPLGVHAAAYLPILWAAGFVRRSFVVDEPLLRGFLILPAAWASAELRELWRWLIEGEGDFFGRAQLYGSLYTTALGIVAHAALDRFRPAFGWRRDQALSSWRR